MSILLQVVDFLLRLGATTKKLVDGCFFLTV